MNGTQDDAGVYTCVGERAMDRTYVSSWVNLAPPLPPVMLFLPCNELASTNSAGTGSSSQPHQVRHLHMMTQKFGSIKDAGNTIKTWLHLLSLVIKQIGNRSGRDAGTS